MIRFVPPIERFATARINESLHGRSVHRPSDVPGHNVFKGYNHPGTGDALDLFAPAGTPVAAICDGAVTLWSNDTEKREVVYLEAPGVVAVYAHIDYLPRPERIPRPVIRGEMIGLVRGDLSDPHLHFELWRDGVALSAPTPSALRLRHLGAPAQDPDAPAPWAKPAVEWCVANGITDGSDLHEPVTLERACVMFYRLRCLIGKADA